MPDFFAHIDDYLEGKLSEENKKLFEREMLSNNELKAAVENHELIRDVSLGFLEDEVREALDNNSTGQRSFRWWILIIALMMLSLVAWYLMRGDESGADIQHKSFAELYEPPAWPIERGAQDDLSEALSLALSGQEQEGIRQLKALDTTEVVRNYWIAEVFAKSGQLDSAKYYLPKTSDDRNLVERIGFLQSLLHLGER